MQLFGFAVVSAKEESADISSRIDLEYVKA